MPTVNNVRLLPLMLSLVVGILVSLRAPSTIAAPSCGGYTCSTCTGCPPNTRGSCGICLTCNCVCHCYSSTGLISRPAPESPGLPLDTEYGWTNDGATASTVLNVFIEYFNWSVEFEGDPDEMTVADGPDYSAASGAEMLAKLGAHLELCYDVDPEAYHVEFRRCE